MGFAFIKQESFLSAKHIMTNYNHILERKLKNDNGDTDSLLGSFHIAGSVTVADRLHERYSFFDFCDVKNYPEFYGGTKNESSW